MLKVQLALQGGGAKLVALVAAMRAVEVLESEKKLVVTRISGTSAGALIATLFAARVPMGEVLTYLEQLDPRRELPPRGKIRMLWALVRGQPFYDGEKVIRKHLVALLEKGHRAKGGNGVPQVFDELEIPTIVAVSDLRERKLVERRNRDNIVTSVADSASFPFVLKALKSSGNACHVDGGICANLPSELLHAETDQSEPVEPVIALSFRPAQAATPDAVTAYALALLDTAIDAWVRRIKDKIGADNVHEIQSKIETLDFATIMGPALKARDVELREITNQAATYFEKYLETAQETLEETRDLRGDPWRALSSNDWRSVQTAEAMKGIFKLHKAAAESADLRIVSNKLLVRGHSLAKLAGASGKADSFMHRTTYEVTRGVLSSHCTAIGVSDGADANTNLLRSRISLVRASDNKPISAERYPAADEHHRDRRWLVFCFDPPLKQGDRFVLEMKDSIKGMFDEAISRAESRRGDVVYDELFMKSERCKGVVERIEIVALVPKVAGWSFAFEEHPSMRADSKGKPFSREELKPLEDSAEQDGKALGWLWENCPDPSNFMVRLVLNPTS